MKDEHVEKIRLYLLNSMPTQRRGGDPLSAPLAALLVVERLLEAHREEFLGEYRRQFPDWERAGVECLADFEKDAAA